MPPDNEPDDDSCGASNAQKQCGGNNLSGYSDDVAHGTVYSSDYLELQALRSEKFDNIICPEMGDKLHKAFIIQRARAKERGIDWELEYWEWLQIWQEAGIYTKGAPLKEIGLWRAMAMWAHILGKMSK